jgi:hypothetical protein
MYGTMWSGGLIVYGHHFLMKLPNFFGAGGGKGLKKGNDIMFIMVSSSCFQVATQADKG